MTILITGATGFIGQKLCHRLACQDHDIHALYRSESKRRSFISRNIKWFKGDINDEKSLERAMTHCDRVFHLAAFAKVWAKDPHTYYRVNYLGTKNVLNAAKKLGVKKIVYTSTAGVFGPSKNNIVDEKASRSGKGMTEYERTKAKAEELIMDYVNQGLQITIVNPSRIFGPGLLSDSNSVTRMIDLYRAGKFRIVPGNGKSIGNYAYIDDVVEGHVLAMEKGESGEKYILGGTNVSYRDFFHTLSGVTGKKYYQFSLPVPLMLALSGAMLLLANTVGVPPLITPRWVMKYNYNWELTSQKSADQLGYRMTSLEEGFRKTIDYLNELKT